jgi:hypothetical protein
MGETPEEPQAKKETPATVASTVPQREEKVQEPPELVAMLPLECDGEAPCEPPAEFTKAACKGKYPGMALKMFEKTSPWQRLYLKAERLEAVNAYGGRATSHPLEFGEEVLVLRGEARSDSSQVQVSGATDIDLLRWEGTCITARREMFVTYMMPETKNAKITWKYLDDNIKAALLERKYVKISYERKKTDCKGSRASSQTPACEKATQKLNDAITVAIRGGMSVPEPQKLPVWASPEQAVARSKTVVQPEARLDER